MPKNVRNYNQSNINRITSKCSSSKYTWSNLIGYPILFLQWQFLPFNYDLIFQNKVTLLVPRLKLLTSGIEVNWNNYNIAYH